jgi:hypothetical protein
VVLLSNIATEPILQPHPTSAAATVAGPVVSRPTVGSVTAALKQKTNVLPRPMHRYGSAAVKADGWPNFWGNLTSFSPERILDVRRRQGRPKRRVKFWRHAEADDRLYRRCAYRGAWTSFTHPFLAVFWCIY